MQMLVTIKKNSPGDDKSSGAASGNDEWAHGKDLAVECQDGDLGEGEITTPDYRHGKEVLIICEN